jgi:hypothetical protein
LTEPIVPGVPSSSLINNFQYNKLNPFFNGFYKWNLST